MIHDLLLSRFRLFLIGTLAFCLDAQAAELEPEPKTLMTERARLVLQEDFAQPPVKPWLITEPIWETIDGAIKATHRPPFPANHGPLLTHPVTLTNAIVQLSFKLDGKSRLTLHFNKQNGHLCRALVHTDAFYVIRRDSGGDKGIRLDSRETPIPTGQWHTLVVEIFGKEMLASLDGKDVIFGTHADLDQPKTMLILEAAAGSAWFKDLRVWEAAPNRHWESTRAALLRSRSAAP